MQNLKIVVSLSVVAICVTILFVIDDKERKVDETSVSTPSDNSTARASPQRE